MRPKFMEVNNRKVPKKWKISIVQKMFHLLIAALLTCKSLLVLSNQHLSRANVHPIQWGRCQPIISLLMEKYTKSLFGPKRKMIYYRKWSIRKELGYGRRFLLLSLTEQASNVDKDGITIWGKESLNSLGHLNNFGSWHYQFGHSAQNGLPLPSISQNAVIIP